jgi:hypothetical protein
MGYFGGCSQAGDDNQHGALGGCLWVFDNEDIEVFLGEEFGGAF